MSPKQQRRALPFLLYLSFLYAVRCDECEGIFNTEIELEYHKEAEGHWSDNEDGDEASEFSDNEPELSNDFVVYCEEAESTEEELLL